MSSIDLLLLGSGGHCKVLIELAKLVGYKKFGVFDDVLNPSINNMEGVLFLGKYDIKLYPNIPLVIAIGNNEIRATLSKNSNHKFATLIHSSAIISKSVEVGKGTVILSNVVIQAGANIGNHVIVKASSVIDHDVIIQDFVHLRPLSYIGSNSEISKYLTINPGQIVERFSKL